MTVAVAGRVRPFGSVAGEQVDNVHLAIGPPGKGHLTRVEPEIRGEHDHAGPVLLAQASGPALCDQRVDLASAIEADHGHVRAVSRTKAWWLAPPFRHGGLDLFLGFAAGRRFGVIARNDIGRVLRFQQELQCGLRVARSGTAGRVYEADCVAQLARAIALLGGGDEGKVGLVTVVTDQADRGQPIEIADLAQPRRAPVRQHGGGGCRLQTVAGNHGRIGRHAGRHVMVDHGERTIRNGAATRDAQIGDHHTRGIALREFGGEVLVPGIFAPAHEPDFGPLFARVAPCPREEGGGGKAIRVVMARNQRRGGELGGEGTECTGALADPGFGQWFGC